MASSINDLGTRSEKTMKIEWYQDIYGENEPDPGMGSKEYKIKTDSKEYVFDDLASALEWMLLNPYEPCALWNLNFMPELILTRE